jgi:hypothetical protein
MDSKPDHATSHFIRHIIDADQASGKHGGRVHALPARAQRLPAHRPCQVDLPQLRHRRRDRRRCNLRFDDTNPLKEDQEYVEAIIDDVRWLGFDWGERLTMPRTTSRRSIPVPAADRGRARPTSDSLTPSRSASTAAR